MTLFTGYDYFAKNVSKARIQNIRAFLKENDCLFLTLGTADSQLIFQYSSMEKFIWIFFNEKISFYYKTFLFVLLEELKGIVEVENKMWAFELIGK